MKIVNVTLKNTDNENAIGIVTQFGEYTLNVDEIKNVLIDRGDLCERCEGSREIIVDEPVEEGGAIMAPVGTQPCPMCSSGN